MIGLSMVLVENKRIIYNNSSSSRIIIKMYISKETLIYSGLLWR